MIVQHTQVNQVERGRALGLLLVKVNCKAITAMCRSGKRKVPQRSASRTNVDMLPNDHCEYKSSTEASTNVVPIRFVSAASNAGCKVELVHNRSMLHCTACCWRSCSVGTAAVAGILVAEVVALVEEAAVGDGFCGCFCCKYRRRALATTAAKADSDVRDSVGSDSGRAVGSEVADLDDGLRPAERVESTDVGLGGRLMLDARV